MHFIKETNNTYISTELSLPQEESRSTDIDSFFTAAKNGDFEVRWHISKVL